MAAILTHVYTEPTHNTEGIGIAINDLGTAVQVYSNPNDNKAFKVSNILLYGPPSGGGGAAPTGAAAQSWSDG
ncbi:MAG TPA: hypothetical protein DCW83_03700 [Saprospirales bacterium]|jgi:hypothetical protein|nr:hypothetical protein [Saprospirales bacterium]